MKKPGKSCGQCRGKIGGISMAECPLCDAENDIENINPGKLIKCAGCGKKLEVIKEGKKKELYETDVEYGD